MTALTSHIRDSEPTPKVVSEALSEDAYKRGIELAFYERVVKLTFLMSASTLRAAKLRKPADLDSEVAAQLQEHRSPLFARLARAMEKDMPPESDFGPFRGPDH